MFNLGTDAIFDSHTQMLNHADIEAIDLMVPIQDNYDIARDVISAKKHLLAEKPFASTVKEAKDLIKQANSKDVKVLVAENFRYTEENHIIKNLIETKKIGNVVYFIDVNNKEFQKEMLEDDFAATEWRQHPEFKGGIFLDEGVHHIARMRFLFGDVDRVFATGRPSEIDYCEYSCINTLLTFGSNITGYYSFYNIGRETQAPLVGLRIFGTEGEIYLEDKNCGYVNLSLKDGTHQAIPYKPEEGYYNELENFYDAIKNNTQIVSTPEKELGDIQVIFDILKSIDNSKCINASNQY